MKERVGRKAVWGVRVTRWREVVVGVMACACAIGFETLAEAQAPGAPAPAPPAAAQPAPVGVPLPSGYVIGPEDVLTIVVWREKDMSTDAVVRPDGKITLPLLNDFQAAGLTPDLLRAEIEKAAAKYMKEPNATVIVKAINSRKVSILGNVGKAGTYPLAGDMTVLQLIAFAGGLQEYADTKGIKIMRKQDGRDVTLKFNYRDVVKGKNLQQNVLLKPGDIVIVP